MMLTYDFFRDRTVYPQFQEVKMPSPRLNLNLKADDRAALLELRKILENDEHRLSLAEVVRKAIHMALDYQQGIKRLSNS